MWKKQEIENKIKKMMVVETEVSLQDFLDLVRKELNEFCEHVTRLRTQYNQLKINKETLPENHVIVQMDFAENYTCRALDEVQTAYWTLTSVTLHPTVVYYKQDETLKHKSFVVVSNTMVHSASTVVAFMDAILPEIQKFQPTLQHVHYWTDSPSSQYRNRFIFNTLANHSSMYGCTAQWNYFEAGHGKSACDGLGGTTKRMADESSRQGNALIQSAQDFYKWGRNSTMKDVTFLFVDKTMCEQKQTHFSNITVKPVRNTMKLHAIAFDSAESSFRTKETSCYCDVCCQGNFCESCLKEKHDFLLEKKPKKNRKRQAGVSPPEKEGTENVKDVYDNVITCETVNTVNGIFESLNVDDFVAAKYDNKIYPGKVVELDEEDKDCYITFMEKAKTCYMYKWPTPEDIIWVTCDDILSKIQPPQQTGKSKRMFKVNEEDRFLFSE